MKTFAGIPEEYAQFKNADACLLPVMYDGTSTWGKGADKALEPFLEASNNMELYDIITDSEVYKRGIYLCDTLEDFQNPERMVQSVYKRCKQLLNKKKFVTLLGGEHSISIGSIRAFREEYDNLTVLQVDAHTDLRPSYQGSIYNHACAMHEAHGTTNLLQVGIRSMDALEKKYMKKENVYFMHKIYNGSSWMKEVAKKCTKNVYVTVDLDAFDSGLMPSTGTPEPGGLKYLQVVDLIRKVARRANIVGFDIVELAPSAYNKAPNFLAAKLYYQILSLAMEIKRKK